MVTLEVSRTYEVITPESAQQGDAAERGWCFKPMFLRLRDTLNEVKRLGYFEVSDHGNHIDLYACDPDRDDETGAETYYHVRIAAKPRALNRLLKLIKE